MSDIRFDRAQPPQAGPSYVAPPYVYVEYPRTLHHASRPPVSVRSDDERVDREAEGYRDTPEAAAAVPERLAQLIANAAAERVASDQTLSAKARAEKLKQDRATAAHVPE